VQLPLTQTDLAEATGLSAVHINRTLQEMRSAGLVILRDHVLTIPDLPALQVAAMFNPAYLHLDHEGHQLDANEA
jgi:DNA-binding IclR family transcriptional regulator